MPEFIRKPAADLSPTECFTCMQADVPMTLLREYISGAAWICDMCIHQLARVVGCSDPGKLEEALQALDLAEQRIEQLEQDVYTEKARQVQVVALKDVMTFATETTTSLVTPVATLPNKRNASRK